MENTQQQKRLIADFIEVIWNRSEFGQMPLFLHPEYQDHSLPPQLETTAKGLQQWIEGTSTAFEHTTIIEQIVSEENRVMIKISLHLKHVGIWRSIEPSGLEITVTGYRSFELTDEKIIRHWALIDGNAIENQLTACGHGCKVQV